MSKYELVFWCLVTLDLIILAFGTLMYRIDPSSDTVMTTLFCIGAVLTLGAGLCWFFE